MAVRYKHIIKVNFQIELYHPTPLDEPEALAIFKSHLPSLIEEDPLFMEDMNMSLYWTIPEGTKEELRDLLT